jgi:hypothetical protein
MCCSFGSFLCLVLVFFNSPTQFLPMKQGLSDVLLFVIPFFTFGLKSIFQQSYQFLWKQGLSDVLLFCDSFLVVLRVFFNSPTQFHLKGIEWCAALCDSFLYVWS